MEIAILVFAIAAFITAAASLLNVIYVNIKVETLTSKFDTVFPEDEEEDHTDEEILEVLGRMELNLAKLTQRVGKLQARARGQQQRKKRDESEVTLELDPQLEAPPLVEE